MVAPTDGTVFIVDDDPASLDSVSTLVMAHGGRVATFRSAEDFLATVTNQHRGCVVVDVRMSGMSGLDLQAQLAELAIELPVILLTGYGDVPMAVRAMQAGAVSFLKKPCDPRELWSTICQALDRGDRAQDRRQNRELIAQRLAELTSEEQAVLERVLRGLPNKVIARNLQMGLRTVELRRASIMKKLRAESLADLVRLTTMPGDDSPR